MGVWDKPGQEDRGMMRSLRQLAEGRDEYGRPIDAATQIAAIERWQQTQIEKGRLINDTSRAESDKLRAENDRMRAENDRLRAVAEVEALRAETGLKLERLQLEKADVIVRALGVAASSGASPEDILGAIQGLSDRLLTGPPPSEDRALLTTTESSASQAEPDEKDLPHYERMRLRRQRAREAGQKKD